MGRVAFTKKAEPVDWFEIESRRQEISGFCRFSIFPIGPSIAPTNDSPAFSSDDSFVSLSSHLDIIAKFQAAIAASGSSNRQTAR
ncbi:hypothetical protein [Bradyrhizobium sp. JYMT SZCCT0428]|uniref:hypothetical protein n=1 Tax=Bradyrhizobium sp. JYMT SZCCT0428 TaxID=2807673 RepID=UPI001BA7125B|nr:hypothetical protein [Bradyrhizobium sp. JYMT SZCCT0428]MBR1155263.1 hypothetical protein [Bradyrhizobium sp. JYMT SZCCT0428]